METLLGGSGVYRPPPPHAAGASTDCSVDALERVVHSTGAGADASFYAAAAVTHAADAAAHLRYWLNPSVRARPTTATCEITNLGAPLFAPTSAGVLRLSASPLFADGRCFPTRCVVSLATSAQRLDGVAVRPVVLLEWTLTEDGQALGTAGSAAPLYSTQVPLRTLFHVASLLSSTAATPAASIDDVRLYLQLRFTGCTDSSDTHRIAAVRLCYEHLGTTAEVLPVLQQRRRTSSSSFVLFAGASPSEKGTPHHHSSSSNAKTSFVEEVEVAVTSSTCSTVESPLRTPSPRRPPPPLRRAEQLLYIPSEGGGDDGELCSPPRRSATKPRPDAASRPKPGCASTPRSVYQHSSCSRSRSSVEARSPLDDDVAGLVRVERTLRLPPPPPSALSTGSLHRDASVAQTPVLGGAPWPPRKTRTIVLAPSISPSLTSSTASPLSSPGSAGGSTPLSHSGDSCTGTPLHECSSNATERVGTAGQPLRRDAAVQDEWHRLEVQDGAVGAARSLMEDAPQQQQRLSSTHHSVVETPVMDALNSAKGEASVGGVAPEGSVQPKAKATAAVLWEATSLLGTAPWRLQSLQPSRRSSPAQSAPASRASSRERSSGGSNAQDAPRAFEAEMKPASASCTPTTAEWSFSRVVEKAGKASVTDGGASDSASSWLGWRTASAVTPSNVLAGGVSAFPAWRSSNASISGSGGGGGDSTHVSPQLQPPRSAGMHTASAASHAPLPSPQPNNTSAAPATAWSTPSAYVPRLNFRASTTRRDAALPASSIPVAAPLYQLQPPPPSQNRDLWTRQAKQSTTTAATHTVVAEHGGHAAWTRPSTARPVAAAAAVDAPAAWSAPFFASSAVDKAQSLKGPLSVVPAAWLEQQQQQQQQQLRPRNPPSSHRPQTESEKRARRSAAAASEMPAASTAHPTLPSRPRDVDRSASSSDDASLDSIPADAAPAPPPTPPPQRRALFHTTAAAFRSHPPSSSPSAASSRSASSAAPQRAPPALPLQEEHHHHLRRRPQEARVVAAPAAAAVARRRDGQRRSRSAPVQRLVQHPSSPVLPSEAAPSVPTVTTATAGNLVHIFPVVKHHASRAGVGRRRLIIRPVGQQHHHHHQQQQQQASGVRCFVALEKVRGVDQLRNTLGLGNSGSGSGCEVPLHHGDVVELWTGLQAVSSGVMHREKVRDVACCVVLRCNRQLVTAVEMETTEAVREVTHLLLAGS